MKNRLLCVLVLLAVVVTLFSGCVGKDDDAHLDKDTPVSLVVAGPWVDFKALEAIIDLFCVKYPNVTIEYEFVQDYYDSLATRMTNDPSSINLFLSTGIQETSPMLPFALDLYSAEHLDLTATFDGLRENFEYRNPTGDEKVIYAMPIGAEMRGMFVNKTLLASCGLSVPKTKTELLAACAVLKDAGYIPFNGNPTGFAQHLVYPYFCNIIANSDDEGATYNIVNSREPGASELFREPCEILYTLIENGYYNYKFVENEHKMFTDASDAAYARYFLNIKDNVKVDDVGTVAFMPSVISLESVIDKTREDYHSEIEYEFVLAPLSEEGGFAYISPAHGIAINKNCENLDWSVAFINFLFKPENSEKLAELHNIAPNTDNAMTIIGERFDIEENHISHLGQVTFEYDFYNAVTSVLRDMSKCNNPKYMVDDGAGNLTLPTFESFMKELETKISGVE